MLQKKSPLQTNTILQVLQDDNKYELLLAGADIDVIFHIFNLWGVSPFIRSMLNVEDSLLLIKSGPPYRR